MKTFNLAIALLLLASLPIGCEKKGEEQSYGDRNAEVPPGDPPFPPLNGARYWVIDQAGVLDMKTVKECDLICRRLQDDGIAELAILVMNGVKHDLDYATHYIRSQKMGKKGRSSEGGNNGMVWLVRPDAGKKATYSIGRGLPRLTSDHLTDIRNKALDFLNFNNYNQGVLVLVQETDKALREIYGKEAGR